MRRPREFNSEGPEQTVDLGRRLGERLRGGEVVLLFGPLGAGKTVFVRGLATGLEVSPEEVRSPSFTLVNEYSGRLTLYHVDLYRLAADALPELGLEDLYGSAQVVAVEWAERLEEAGWDLGDSIIVEIDYLNDEDDARLVVIDDGGLVTSGSGGEG